MRMPRRKYQSFAASNRLNLRYFCFLSETSVTRSLKKKSLCLKIFTGYSEHFCGISEKKFSRFYIIFVPSHQGLLRHPLSISLSIRYLFPDRFRASAQSPNFKIALRSPAPLRFLDISAKLGDNCRKGPKNSEDGIILLYIDCGLLRAFDDSTHAQWKGKLPAHRNLQENRKCQR